MNQSNTKDFTLLEEDNLIIRKSELDDIERLQVLIENQEDHIRDGLNQLYDYPKLLSLFEKSYLSISVVKADQIVGCVVFNDFPQGSFGMVDYKHENYWDFWLKEAFDLDGIDITSYNVIWQIYSFLDHSMSEDEKHLIMQQVYQHVYGTLPNNEYILFLLRGEAKPLSNAIDIVNDTLQNLFINAPQKNKERLRQIRGIHLDSELYYSNRDMCCQQVIIRMAKEEDHDDLAEIFNHQSEVQTDKFGEFFIADMIAMQNQTRQNTKDLINQGKALVAEVGQKAVGIMSLSSDIDFSILAKNYELDIFDNLIKRDVMTAIRDRQQELIDQKNYQEHVQKQQKKQRLHEETMQCRWIGQRMCLQNFLSIKEIDIKNTLEALIQHEENQKQVTKEVVEKMIDGWISGFKFNQPSKLFLESQYNDHNLLCIIQSERNFFLETLTYFGLPKNYMNGEGHWQDWEKKKLEELRAAQLRRPMKKKAKNTNLRKKKEEDEANIIKPPSWFDLSPLLAAFQKYVAVTSESMALFAQEIDKHRKEIISLFTNENGEMDDSLKQDLNTLGFTLNKMGLEIPMPVVENMCSILECYGDISPLKNVIQVMPKPKDDKDKQGETKKFGFKQEEAKPIDVVQKLVSFEQFDEAFKKQNEFIYMMQRLGHINSQTLQPIIQASLAKEKQYQQNEHEQMVKERIETEYEHLVKDLNDLEQVPKVPEQEINAFVINLFCIDQRFQSRSQDFLEYAFKLFPGKDYIILTQPHTIPESILLQNFLLVPKKQNSTFDHVLYIMHKDALCSKYIKVRKSEVSDIGGIQPYIQDLDETVTIQKDMTESIKENASKKMAFSVFCKDKIIGMYILSKNVNLAYYVSHFCVQDHIILDEHPQPSHSRLLHSILNPLFSKSSLFIMKEILRLSNKTTIFYETHKFSLLPDIFSYLHIVRARRFPKLLDRKWDFQHEEEYYEKMGDMNQIQDGDRDPLDQEDSTFALAMISKKFVHTPKQYVNNRIIVVGASDTGISTIESLITIKALHFTNLTLLAPGGLITMNCKDQYDMIKPASTNYTLRELKNLMLEARVTVMDAKMVKIDKHNKKIHLDKDAVMSYDLLVTTVGLIDTELQSRNLISNGVYKTSQYKGYQNKQSINGVYSIDDPYLYEHFKVTGKRESNMDLLTRKKKPENIAIYGRSLDTISMINFLQQRGVSGKRIHLIMPHASYTPKSSFSTIKEKLEQDDFLVSDPYCFEDEMVEKKIFEIIEKMGVTVWRDYQIEDIESKNSTVQRINIKKYQDKSQESKKDTGRKEFEKRPTKVVNVAGMNNEANSEDNNGSMQQEDESIPLSVRFLVTSCIRDIDQEIFHIIHENGLVYNGRLIVKNNFQTTDPAIFACGRICEFSQRYKHYAVGKSLRLDKYNGRELGLKLSHSLLEALDLGYLVTENIQIDDQKLPKLYMPVGLGCGLPNKLIYYNVKKDSIFSPQETLNAEKNREDFVSDNIVDGKGQYIRFRFDNDGIIENVTYLSYEDVNVSSIVSFVGLSEYYLNQLGIRLKSNLIPNITEFLSENWAMALYHEWFSEFRYIIKSDLIQNQEMMALMSEVKEHALKGEFMTKDFYEQIKQKITVGLTKQIKDGTINFLRKNQNHLPMYYVPPANLI